MNNNPILNNPYSLPLLHHATDPKDGSLNYNDIRKGRRIFSRDKQVIPMKQAEGVANNNDFIRHQLCGLHKAVFSVSKCEHYRVHFKLSLN